MWRFCFTWIYKWKQLCQRRFACNYSILLKLLMISSKFLMCKKKNSNIVILSCNIHTFIRHCNDIKMLVLNLRICTNCHAYHEYLPIALRKRTKSRARSQQHCSNDASSNKVACCLLMIGFSKFCRMIKYDAAVCNSPFNKHC